jgi:hypothetical protein
MAARLGIAPAATDRAREVFRKVEHAKSNPIRR